MHAALKGGFHRNKPRPRQVGHHRGRRQEVEPGQDHSKCLAMYLSNENC